MKLNPGVLTSELPINTRFGFISSFFIGIDLSFEALFIWYSPVQTLPHQYAQLYLRHIKPTGVLGCVVKLKLAKYSSGFCWFKGFIQRRPLVSVEVVHHYSDHLSLRVSLVHQPFHLIREVSLRPPRSHRNMSPSCLWLAEYKQVARAASLVLVIISLGSPRPRRQALANFLDQLLAGFIEVHFWALFIIRLLIQVKHVFHQRHELSIYFWNAPLLFSPRLERVFFISLRTDSREKFSLKPSSTTLPASNRIVQCFRPCGALLQATAMMWACCLPVSFGRAPGLGRSSRAPSPASTNLLRVRSTVATPQLRAAAIWSSVSPSLAFSKMRARVTFREEFFPRRTSWRSRFRSSAVKSIKYFFLGNSGVLRLRVIPALYPT
jgi:hypothetical protein